MTHSTEPRLLGKDVDSTVSENELRTGMISIAKRNVIWSVVVLIEGRIDQLVVVYDGGG
jgi:hypothetical protein